MSQSINYTRKQDQMFTTIEPKFLFVHTGYESKLDKSYIKHFNELVEETGYQFELVAVKSDKKVVFDFTDADELNPSILKQIDKSVAVFQVDHNYMGGLNYFYLENRVYCASYFITQMKYDAENKVLYVELDSENG